MLKILLICGFICLLFILKSSFRFFLHDRPLVTIIIPVHNNFNFTYNCISSILKAEPLLSFEIIIINDLSIDETKFLKEKYFNNYTNIFIYNNIKRQNFLINCNIAVELSRGKYIIFLNNDTKVHKFWLSFLLQSLNSNDKIGMVGSKLIYPNGVLQEAGGIVWNNGKCSNYGNGKRADLPEYNYIKEVDYISGISIMIKKNLWRKIGGFDKRFIPAYYEDTDFAFQLRKLGYKVFYQPRSVVEHYEGISNGKNPNIKSSIKHYQLINKKKFIEKWKKELNYQSEPGNMFIARDRSMNKSRILVVDRFVPNYDKDAGGRCCFMYLKLFKKIGLQVTFLPENSRKIEPYTTILQQLGIEVLYGESYTGKKLENWMKENLKFFTFIYLQRPLIAKKYIDLIKEYFNGKIFYFAHDLHHIRLMREYNITHLKKYYFESINAKKVEFEIFKKVDIIHVVGNYEYEYLQKRLNNKIIRNIPLFIFENQYEKIEKDFSKRKDLIFVGGFKHSPNVDAILWFSKNIFPYIVKKYPNIILHIISSSIPLQIEKLESKNIKIEGFLPDSKLHLIYQKCRIAIAPLRYGAGVKGKIIEAAHNQIPIVTTSIGSEGIDNSTGAFIVEDDPIKMAKIICDLYVNYTKLKYMSNSGKVLIEKYFSFNKAKEIILRDINI